MYFEFELFIVRNGREHLVEVDAYFDGYGFDFHRIAIGKYDIRHVLKPTEINNIIIEANKAHNRECAYRLNIGMNRFD